MGQGTLVVPRHVAQRSRCQPGGHTVAATTGTPFYRVPTAADVVTLVRPWRCPGWPIQAIVAACGLDERTVAAWVTRAGRPCQPGHQPVVQPGQVDLPQVHADARWVQLVGRRVWMAMALAVPSRWWRGGGVSPPRDRGRITTLVPRRRSCARSLTLLVRRGCAMAHTKAPRRAGMWRGGGADHGCWLPVSLRVAAPAGACWTWQERTPAMAAGLTTHRWAMRERWRDQVPLSPWVAATRRGRPPRQA